MIASSRWVKVLALGLAVSGHASMALMMPGSEAVQIESGSSGMEARLGDSFADLASGVQTATETPDTQTPVTPETPVAATPPAPSTAPPPPPVPEQIAALQPAPAPAPLRDPPPAATPKPDVVRAAPESAPPETSPKPRRRAEKPAPRPEPGKDSKEQPRKQPRGNANSNARAGQQDGREQARARNSGAGGQQQAPGNAAASNYAGLVMRKLSRVARPRVGSRGTAVIAFRVDVGGGLASASVARSSGSAELDRAALRLVRRAAPFPKPPAGAQRSFSIQIQGR